MAAAWLKRGLGGVPCVLMMLQSFLVLSERFDKCQTSVRAVRVRLCARAVTECVRVRRTVDEEVEIVQGTAEVLAAEQEDLVGAERHRRVGRARQRRRARASRARPRQRVCARRGEKSE